MNCPHCEQSLYIEHSSYTAEDNIPYQILEFTCNNEKCTNYKKIVHTDKIKLS